MVLMSMGVTEETVSVVEGGELGNGALSDTSLVTGTAGAYRLPIARIASEHTVSTTDTQPAIHDCQGQRSTSRR